MPQMPDDQDIAAVIEPNFGACEERGLESCPSDEDVDEDHESPAEQGKSTLSSARSPSELVRSDGAKAGPKTAELSVMSEGRAAAKTIV